jgi:drug/metabolite transporter (DMT)-like permease
MALCFVAFWFVRIAAPAAVRDSIMPDAEKVIPWDTYLYGLLPISVLYGYCLGAGNLAFMFSSVAFLQMVKPINVLFTSLAAFAFQLETATMSHVIIVCIIFGGVSLAATGDVEFSLIGCVLQLTACSCEGIRLALLQKVMTKDARLDPVTTVYRFAPVAGLSLCLVACFVETPVDWGRLKSPSMLVMNCVVALVLNVLIVTVIKKASAVVFTLAGILKDVGTICASVVMFQTPIAPLEVVGYGLSMCGISMFKCYKDNIEAFKREGFFGGFYCVMTGGAWKC